MAINNSELMNKVSGVSKPVPVANQVHAYLDKMKVEIARALPKHMTADRVARMALTEIRSTPKLLQCSIESLMACVMKASQEGLEFGTGDAYLVPYGNQAQYIRGYRGCLKLLRRSKEVSNIACYPVYSNDRFEIQLGANPDVKHVPDLSDVKGDFRGCYVIADVAGEGRYIEWMSKKEIDAIKGRSKASGNGPWVTDYVEMARKTVLKRACKYLPMAVEIAEALEADNKVEFGDSEPIEINLGEGNANLPVVEAPQESEVSDEN
jgi:recombination protein RecT